MNTLPGKPSCSKYVRMIAWVVRGCHILVDERADGLEAAQDDVELVLYDRTDFTIVQRPMVFMPCDAIVWFFERLGRS